MNFYNENDPRAAEWLRNLIQQNLIPNGYVDERSIKEVQASDLAGYTQCHFFAGIGGWSYALQLAGWPDDVPVWTGSCPCQPFSDAGKKRGEQDERHLWPEFHRLIAECGPPVVFGEQVASSDGRGWLSGVRADLETLDYAVGAADMCAASVQSPNKRQRLWWVADADQPKLFREQSTGKQPEHEQDEGPAVGVADAWSERCREGSGGHGNESGARGNGIEFGSGCELSRLANAADLRSPEYVHDARERQAGPTDNSANSDGACRLGDATSEGQPFRKIKQDGRGVVRVKGTPAIVPGAPWLRTRVIECRDGRSRRVSAQPGDEPLAYGIPIRMGRGKSKRRRMEISAARANRLCRLKGYGNAIVPQVAAVFIRAFLDLK